ncbi:DUF1810 domain-containing protein [Polynucleobacter sp. Nonnen-W13]|uniref:DUF1810 domain-containing protein n=1 Tax=Polynucleobacter sp. Nonnen-W13 TaxID=1855625 RepID=UPI001C0B2EFD|nr:DUF1810 family protein [Polynucleobacter sp. Nonnen-W13]MBU3558734.1 DUF1810 family protein [Polynucleobacter sp. Nonnen-W13]
MLDHFIEAQNPIYDQVLEELRNGYKKTHWMWFIFPQLKGLGTSPISIRYAIQDELQANEYWNHPILGNRLRECFNLVEQSGKAPELIFSPIDALKYRSCKALFSQFMG